MCCRPILRQGDIYKFKRGGKHVRIDSVGNYECIGKPDRYYYTVWVLESGERYAQNEYALVPQLQLEE